MSPIHYLLVFLIPKENKRHKWPDGNLASIVFNMVDILSAVSTLPRALLASVRSDMLPLWRALSESRLLFSELSAWQRFSSSSWIPLVMSGLLGLEGLSSLAERHVVILRTCTSSWPRDRAPLVATNLQVLPSLGSRRERWGPSYTIRDVSFVLIKGRADVTFLQCLNAPSANSALYSVDQLFGSCTALMRVVERSL